MRVPIEDFAARADNEQKAKRYAGFLAVFTAPPAAGRVVAGTVSPIRPPQTAPAPSAPQPRPPVQTPVRRAASMAGAGDELLRKVRR